MIVGLAVQRAHEGNLVDEPADVRKQLRHLQAALSVFLELERARHQGTRIALSNDDVAGDLAVQRLTGIPG